MGAKPVFLALTPVLSPLEKSVMDRFIAAAMRDQPGHECVRAAIEAWLREQPGDDRATAERRVGRLVDAARQEVI